MAECVIHLLEPVQVDEHQCKCEPTALGIQQFLFQMHMKHVAVGQFGQGIVVGLLANQRVGFLLLSDVADERAELGLTFPAHHRNSQLYMKFAAIAAQSPGFH